MSSYGRFRRCAMCGATVILVAVCLFGVSTSSGMSGKVGDPPVSLSDGIIVDAALVSDLDGDGVAEFRILLTGDDDGQSSRQQTFIISGQTGRLLFVIHGDEPFNAWPTVPGDYSFDGTVDEDDLYVRLLLESWSVERFWEDAFLVSIATGFDAFEPLRVAIEVGEAGHIGSGDRAIGILNDAQYTNVEVVPDGEVIADVDDLREIVGSLNEVRHNPPIENANAVRQEADGIESWPRRSTADGRALGDRRLQGRGGNEGGVLNGLPQIPANALWAVDFGSAGRHDIYSDRVNAQGAHWKYEQFEWWDQNLDGAVTGPPDHHHPMAFTISTQQNPTFLSVGYVGFRIAPSESLDMGSWRIAGYVAGQTSPIFVGTSLARNNYSLAWDVIYSATVTGSFPCATVIDVWDEWTINWFLEQTSGGGASIGIGLSQNTIYFTLKPPVLEGNEQLYHTVIDIACRGSAGKSRGPTDSYSVYATILKEDIWPRFATRSIVRVQDVHDNLSTPAILGYYRDWATNNIFVGELLAHADGQCGAWARLLACALKAHGITQSNDGVYVYSVAAPNQLTQFLVREWVTPPGTSLPANTYPYQRGYRSANTLPSWVNSLDSFEGWRTTASNGCWTQTILTYCFTQVAHDTEDLPGIAGQGGVANPASMFGNHQLFWFVDTLYDPSYGSMPIVSTAAVDPWKAAAQTYISQNIVYYAEFFGVASPGVVFSGQSEVTMVFKAAAAGTDIVPLQVNF